MFLDLLTVEKVLNSDGLTCLLLMCGISRILKKEQDSFKL